MSDSSVEEGVWGTPAYMAPEQAAGKQAQRASDWYAVGVILYEALTGRAPYWGSARAIMEDKINKDPIAPYRRAPGVPEDLSALCMDLLNRDSSARPTGNDILRRFGEQAKVSLIPWREKAITGDALIGREPQLSILKDAFDTSRTGKPVLVLLSGKAGMGKSALLQQFIAHVGRQTRAVVLSGRCYENESIPYKALDNIIDALHQYLSGCEPSEIESLWPDGISALGLLFPVLTRLDAVRPKSELKTLAIDSLQLRNIAYRALKELLRRIAERQPLVVTIDNLQWGDMDSAQLLKKLLTPPDSPSLLLVASYRSEEPAALQFTDLISQSDELNKSALTIYRLNVEALTSDQALQLAKSLLASGGENAESHAETICRESDQSPLLLAELAGYFIAKRHPGGKAPTDMPYSLTEVIRSRLSQVPKLSRELFELVCVSGKTVDQTVLADALKVDRELHDALRSLRNKRLITLHRSPGKTNVDVYHNRVRDTVLAELSAEKTRAYHLLLADSYERSGDTDPYLLAIHFQQGGDPTRAAVYAEKAADNAAAALAFDRAARMYRMALELRSEGAENTRSLKIRLAEALSNAGRGGDAAPLFFQAAEGASFEEALSLRRRAAEQWLVSGNTEDGMRALALVLDAVGLSLPDTPRKALADVLLTRAKLRLKGLRYKERREQDIPSLDLLRVDVCNVSTALGFVNTALGAAFQARHLWLALKIGEPFRIALGLGREAMFNSIEGGHKQRRVRELQQMAQTLTRTLDNPIARAYDALVEGETNYMFGRWKVCSDALETAEKILMERCTGVTWELNSLRFFWGNSLVFQGRWLELGRRLGLWIDDARARSDVYALSGLQILGTRCVTLSSGDVARAREEIDAGIRVWGSKQYSVQHFLAEVSKIQLDLYELQVQAAAERVERLRAEFFHSMMRRVQLCRIHAYHHSGYVYLSLAEACSAGDRPGPLAAAERHARALEKEAIEWAEPFAAYIRSTIQYLSGNHTAAIDGLRRAHVGFNDAHMSLYAAATQRRLGQLLKGNKGRELEVSAEAIFVEQGVSHPAQLARMMAPGFGA